MHVLQAVRVNLTVRRRACESPRPTSNCRRVRLIDFTLHPRLSYRPSEHVAVDGVDFVYHDPIIVLTHSPVGRPMSRTPRLQTVVRTRSVHTGLFDQRPRESVLSACRPSTTSEVLESRTARQAHRFVQPQSRACVHHHYGEDPPTGIFTFKNIIGCSDLLFRLLSDFF